MGTPWPSNAGRTRVAHCRSTCRVTEASLGLPAPHRSRLVLNPTGQCLIATIAHLFCSWYCRAWLWLAWAQVGSWRPEVILPFSIFREKKNSPLSWWCGVGVDVTQYEICRLILKKKKKKTRANSTCDGVTFVVNFTNFYYYVFKTLPHASSLEIPSSHEANTGRGTRLLPPPSAAAVLSPRARQNARRPPPKPSPAPPPHA